MDSLFKQIALALRSVLDLLMPRRCVVCGCELNLDEDVICLPCAAGLPYTHFWDRAHNPMADAFNSRLSIPDGVYEPYAFAAALFFYRDESDYKHIPWALKYEAHFESGRFFAASLGRKLAASPLFCDVDAVIPVPLHPLRRLRRGYNQSEIIGKEVARELGAELLPKALQRVRYTRSQTSVETSGKAENVSDAFRAHRKKKRYRHLLLVDDTFTSGSTLASCHNAIRNEFGYDVRISVATIAYVESL